MRGWTGLPSAQREVGSGWSSTDRVAGAAPFVPNHKSGVLSEGGSHFFCGSYSTDGSVYMSACQGDQSPALALPPPRRAQALLVLGIACSPRSAPAKGCLRRERFLRCADATITLHDTQDNGRVIKTIEARDIGWSIIDTDYSPDQRFLIYSSWSPYGQARSRGTPPFLHFVVSHTPRAHPSCSRAHLSSNQFICATSSKLKGAMSTSRSTSGAWRASCGRGVYAPAQRVLCDGIRQSGGSSLGMGGWVGNGTGRP